MTNLHGLFSTISSQFFNNSRVTNYRPLPGGHIHRTYVVQMEHLEYSKQYIFQNVNTDIFSDPESIMHNISILSRHLEMKKNAVPRYDLDILSPKQTLYSSNGVWFEGSYWRVFPYFANALCLNRVNDLRVAESAGKAFGHFLYHLSELDASKLRDILPGFHSGSLRVKQFQDALDQDRAKRIKCAPSATRKTIADVRNALDLLFEFDRIKENLPKRVIHHDAKLNNVLLNKDTFQPISVIDLDTVMSGTVLSDFGDLVRSLSSSHSEDNPRPSNLEIDMDIYKAVSHGFLKQAHPILIQQEIDHLVLGAQAITLMVAVRFLTDYLNGDQYFQTDYPEHNLVRTVNQMALFRALENREAELLDILESFFVSL
ncbi:MAG: hypothetical protein CSA81_10300 [Acidobacteria bacterium]|nr:MAG: hypothetical protein CSA81_10300 [Acidobacteriota bacterium]